MAWDDTKEAAQDPDNPTANQQFPYSEHNVMVEYLKDKISNHAVVPGAIADNKILVYKAAGDGTFAYEDQNEITTLNDIPDVVISGVPADNEVLAYDGVGGGDTSKFINQTAAEAGLATTTQLATLETAAVLNADFNAATFLYATIDNTPQPKTVAETLAILSVESGADVTDATSVNAAGAVMESDFDATTFLYATADNTPLPKTPAETLAILSGTAAAEFLFNTKQVGGIVNPTTDQQAATKNYADIHIAAKDFVIPTPSWIDGDVAVYRTADGKFHMEAQSAAMGLPVVDTTEIVKSDTAGNARMRFELGGVSIGQTRVMTIPDRNTTLCGTDEVMLLNGANAMGADLDMDDRWVKNINVITPYDAAGILIKDSTGVTAMWIGATTGAIIAGNTLDLNDHGINDVAALIFADATELTIVTGAITATQSYHTIDTESDAATDDLDTISGGTAGMTLMIRAINSARTVVAKDGTGNLQLSTDMSLDTAQDTLTMIYDGTNWLETGRSNNGA